MSWLFSRALVAASSADTCSDGEQSAQLSMTPTPQAYLWRDKMTDAWRRFPSGMTCEHLTESRGEELLTSFRAGFPAKTFPQPDAGLESTENEVDCGAKWPGSLARYDPGSRSWKTRQCLLLGDLEEFSETFPNWGMTRGGELFRRPTPSGLLEIRARITCGNASGLSLQIGTPMANNKKRSVDFQRKTPSLEEFVKKLPTPRATDGSKGTRSISGAMKELQRGVNIDLPTFVATQLPTPKASEATMQRNRRPLSEHIGGKLNPQWVEWLMGWPIGWTDLAALETDKWQQWRRSHGDC